MQFRHEVMKTSENMVIIRFLDILRSTHHRDRLSSFVAHRDASVSVQKHSCPLTPIVLYYNSGGPL